MNLLKIIWHHPMNLNKKFFTDGFIPSTGRTKYILFLYSFEHLSSVHRNLLAALHRPSITKMQSIFYGETTPKIFLIEDLLSRLGLLSYFDLSRMHLWATLNNLWDLQLCQVQLQSVTSSFMGTHRAKTCIGIYSSSHPIG